jgi:phytoene dehydrogenase-like protein
MLRKTTYHACWKGLAADQTAYDEKKDQVARTVVELLDQRFPGISGPVKMVNVATPQTFERYTGNWQVSCEGWLFTPENSRAYFKRPMRQILPGLEGFHSSILHNGNWCESQLHIWIWGDSQA